MDLGSHAVFIVAAYVVAAAIVLSLTVWIALDYRRLQRTLSELEQRGIKRRSSE